MSQPRVAVIGAGAFGQNHCRVVHESGRAQLAAIVDTDAARANEAATRYQTVALTDARELAGKVDAAIIAAPTTVNAANAMIRPPFTTLVTRFTPIIFSRRPSPTSSFSNFAIINPVRISGHFHAPRRREP